MRRSDTPDMLERLKLPGLPRAQMDALAKRAQAGDRRAEDELLRRCIVLVATYCRDAFKRAPEWAEDVILETISRTWATTVHTWDPTQNVAFTAYLTTFTKRVAWTALHRLAHETTDERKHPRNVVPLDADLGEGLRLADLVEAPGPSPEMSTVDSRTLKQVLSALNGRDRLILVKRAQGEGLAQIGLHLGVSRETIRVAELRALAQARSFAAMDPKRRAS